MSENAIEIRNMSKSFLVSKDKSHTLKERLIRGRNKASRHEVLKNISLDIQKGETVALIGVNGSGKSTLLKIMTRILYPNAGTVKTYGKVTSLLELGAGFHQDFTGRENIYFNASIFGLNRAEIDKRIDQIIEFSELGEFIDEPVRTYSSGMYMRLAFSVAINVDADILLIDEILAVGDQHFQNKCFAKLEELRDSDTTIVIVSHSLDTVKNLCSRAVWIYKGELKMDGDPAYVISAYLKQSAKDNQEKEKEHILSPVEQKGVLYLDSPRSFSEFSEGEVIPLSGWAVSNSHQRRVEVLVNGKPLSLMPVARKDVYEIYEEEYAGMIDEQTIGFASSFPAEKGEHTIEALLFNGEHQIDRKKLIVRVK